MSARGQVAISGVVQQSHASGKAALGPSREALTAFADTELWVHADRFLDVLSEPVNAIQLAAQLEQTEALDMLQRLEDATVRFRAATTIAVEKLSSEYGSRAAIGARMVVHDSLNAAAYVSGVFLRSRIGKC